MKSDVKRHVTEGAAKGKRALAAQDDRSNEARRDSDQGVVRLPAELDDVGGGIN
jgi:hypothetical protein